MSFPRTPAVNKHRFFTPTDEGTLSAENGLTSTSAIFQALDNVSNLQPLGDVYSYDDAPHPPLCRDLLIVCVADRNHTLFRKLSILEDDDVLPDCLQRSTVTTRRADGAHGSKLRDDQRKSAAAFSKFLRLLQREQVVAIGSKDKHGRFLMLIPPETVPNDPSPPFSQDDFVGKCFVGDVEKVKEFLVQGVRAVEAPPAEPAGGGDADEMVWKPDDDAAAETTTTTEAAAGLWEPPGSESNTNDAAFSWQPPGADSGDGGFGASDSGFGTDNNNNNNNNDTGFGETSVWGEPESGNGATDNFASENGTADDGNDKKRKRDDDGFHTNDGAAAADNFYSNLTRSLDTRDRSRIFHMRAFNGWVKATQIAELNPKTGKRESPLRILDLACGKGGDLGKWVLHRRGISNYVGSDVARGSLKDAAIRVRGMSKQKLKRCTFTCADLGSDVPGRLKHPSHQHMQKLLTWVRNEEPDHPVGDPEFRMLRGGGIGATEKFDVVSIQFAIHYMMQTRKRARRFFQTVSELLEIGGNLIATTIDARVVIGHLANMGLDLHFDEDKPPPPPSEIVVGNGACRIKFQPEIVRRIFQSKASASGDSDDLFGLEYSFTLVEGSDHASGVGDAVNLPEWLTPLPSLKKLAADAGLELDYAQNFHEFYKKRQDPSQHADAHNALYNMKVLNRNGSLSAQEWEISRLYCAVRFRKVRESSVQLDDDDPEGEEEEEHEAEPEPPKVEISPMQKAKLIVPAMKLAKEKAGADVWQGLSAAEKQSHIDRAIQTLASKGA